jgi:hypothetical protein
MEPKRLRQAQAQARSTALTLDSKEPHATSDDFSFLLTENPSAQFQHTEDDRRGLMRLDPAFAVESGQFIT